MFATLIAVTVFVACNNAETKPAKTGEATETPAISPELQAKHEEARRVHDEIMPRRTELVDVQSKLAAASTGDEREAFAKTRLEKADEAMMNWMYNDEPLENAVKRLGAERASEHLDLRIREIKAIGDSMDVAIAFGKELVK